MNYEKRFREIREFLKTHDYLYQEEMLLRFDHPIPSPYKEWCDDLSKLSYSELMAIENNHQTSNLKNEEFINFIIKIKELIYVERLDIEEVKLDHFLTRKMNKKKQHEIQTLKSIIDKNKEINTFIDIGSGAGHLSLALVHNQNKKSYCVDLNSNFQKIGIDKIKRWCPENIDKINFVNLEIKPQAEFPFNYIKKNTMILGLHSCGALSTEIIKLKFPHLLNFGCCYHKLNDEYNISQVAKLEPLIFSNHALTLAAKSQPTISDETVAKKILVKKYRYALHLYLKENMNLDFTSIGNTHKDDYKLDFAQYALKYCKLISEEEIHKLNDFYEKNIKKIELIIKSGTLRALLSRLIELYIIFDRAVYLIENNVDIKVLEIFKKSLSPRNIGIISKSLLSD